MCSFGLFRFGERCKLCCFRTDLQGGSQGPCGHPVGDPSALEALGVHVIST